jgi:CheY-like chemotaxis protein/anti-sigma regulatory factor (Ser/Thr protein kinase)
VDLNRLADDVLQVSRGRWRDEAQVAGVSINARLEAGDIPTVTGDEVALRELLLNLILNAVDAIPRAGEIVIRTWADDDAVHCSVSDNGVGMPPEVRQRALEPFFTTKGPKSRGLGLSVNYGIVRQHRGRLRVDSVEGRGTTVTVSLPVATRSRGVTGATASPPVATAPLRILLIDDERQVRSVIGLLLEAQGHSVVEATSGVEALARLERGEPFDLVLTDLGMPELNGWDVVEAAKRLRPSLPVVLVTGWGRDPAGRRAGQPAPDAILAKPVTEEVLAGTLEKVTGRAPR